MCLIRALTKKHGRKSLFKVVTPDTSTVFFNFAKPHKGMVLHDNIRLIMSIQDGDNWNP